MRALHQFVPTLEPGAIGAHMLELQRLARDVLGAESELFAEYTAGAYRGGARHHGDYGRRVPARPGDVLLYHMAVGSTVADFVADRTEPLVVDHHNITPGEFLQTWEPAAAYGCSWGRAQLRELAGRADLGVADSPYNEQELVREGYVETATAPILLDLSTFEREVDEPTLARLEAAKHDGGADWLFVGRLSPNKCQHDLVKALAVYRRLYDPAARLRLVGGSASKAYVDAIGGFAAELGIADAVDMAGGVSPGALAAYYRAADAFVCVSEHEGFCIPLLEAMHHRVPVVAYGSTAVPGTLADGGILLDDKGPATVAAAVHRVVADADVRRAVVDAGTRRLADFSLDRTRATWVEALARLDPALAGRVR